MQASRLAVLTRPAGRNEALAERLRAQGWETLALPALRIVPLVPQPLPRPADYDVVVFVSGNAVRHYFSSLAQTPGTPVWPAATAAAVVGEASAAALRAVPRWPAGAVLLQPAEGASQDSEALWEVLRARPASRRVLIVRGTEGRDWLAEQLAGQGVQVDICAVYARQPETWSPGALARLHEAARDGQAAHWLITSAESLQAVTRQLEQAGLQAWFAACPGVTVHPRLADLWRRYAADTIGHDEASRAMVQISMPADEALARAFPQQN
ncbi:Uroporphyrinogen-III synthase [plant metagenome]|uniref:Uroporphyrinogen-III synthase n=2 Tax=root TaxID=1 RepID=A0A1C3K8D0_9BURK|nr:uroporphyrinogen-III synthase [Orrella dioscoreae]SBT27779.1 Uroporphyrinogen-III synthase [Orrella dioscoreae]SOE49345.1 Uroporphyrinogen-III synthase [Orrella dioscoreae]